MKKSFTLLAFSILCLMMFRCNKNFDPLSGSSDSELPLTYTYDTSADNVTVLSSPLFIADRDTLGENGGASSYANDLFEFSNGSYWDTSVRKEFVIHQTDSFRVRIQNCPVGKAWNFCIDSVDQVTVHKAIIPVSASMYDCLYTFKPTRACKGYIGFYELAKGSGHTISSNSPGFIIGYTVDYLEEMFIRFDKIDWTYNLEEDWSDLAVSLKGQSNAMKLKIESYGDGILSVHPIPMDSQGNFDITRTISFRYGVSDYLKTNTRIALYGTAGPPKIILIKNPLS